MISTKSYSLMVHGGAGALDNVKDNDTAVRYLDRTLEHGREILVLGGSALQAVETRAVSATGYGEDFMRSVIAKTIADFIYMKDMDARAANDAGIEYLTREVEGRGGVIVIDGSGNCASGFTTKKMVHGWIEHGGEPVVRFRSKPPLWLFLPAKQADRHASRIPIHEGLSGVHLPISATIARECITPKRKLSLRAYPPLLASAKDGGITSRKEFSLEALIQVI